MIRLLEVGRRFSPASRTMRQLVVALAGLLGGLLAFLVHRAAQAVVWALVSALATFLLLQFAGPVVNRAVWQRTLQKGRHALFGKRVVTIASNGLKVVSSEGATELPWTGVERIRSDADFLLFFTAGGGIAIPRSAFASAKDSESFFATARELHRALAAA